MNKLHTYFGQVVTNDELNELFNTVAGALEQFITDFGFAGVVAGGAVGQNSTPNLSVVVVGPTVAYDALANRILVPSSPNVPVTLDENNQPTAVVNAGNEKWLSIFAKFVSTPTDPRVDEAGDPVFYRDVAGYQLRVAQGSEAAIGTAPRPALRGDQVLLADIRLIANQTTVVNADVSFTRAQNLYNLTGTPLSVTSKDLRAVLQAIVNAVNAISANTLAVPAITGSPDSLSAGSVTAEFTAVLALINALKNYVLALPSAAGAAKLANTQTFTGGNTFNGSSLFVGSSEFRDQLNVVQADASRALVASGNVPADDSVSGNKWAVRNEFKTGTSGAGGQYWRLYVGRDGTTYGSAVMVLNASWDKANQRWVARDTALDAIAILMTYRRVTVSTVIAGTANWNDWPQDLPVGAGPTAKGLLVQESLMVGVNMTVGNDASVGDDLHVGGDLNVDAKSNVTDIDVAGTLKLIGGIITAPGGSVDMTGVDLTIDDLTADKVNCSEVLYTAGNTFRATELNLSAGQPGTNRSGYKPCWVYLNGVWQAVWWEFDNQATPGITGFGSEPCTLDIPLRLPHLGVLKKIEVIHYQADTQSNDFNLIQRTTASWSSAAAPPADTLYGADSLAVTSGWKKTEIFSLLSGGVTISAGSTWFLRCWAGKTAVPNTDAPVGSSNPILGSVLSRVRLTWDDNGPRNF